MDKIKTNFSVEMYLRFERNKTVPLSVHCWLMSLKNISYNRIIAGIYKKTLQQCLKNNTADLQLLHEKERNAFLEELGKIPELFKIDEKSEDFIKFCEHAKTSFFVLITYGRDNLKKGSVLLYYQIYQAVSEFSETVKDDKEKGENYIPELTMELYVLFAMLSGKIKKKIEDEKYISELLKWLSSSPYDRFADNQERLQYIKDIMYDLFLGGQTSPNIMNFIMFWDQIISRQSYMDEYLIAFLKEIISNSQLDENNIPKVTPELLSELSHSIVLNIIRANAPKAHCVKLLSAGLVALGLAVTYIPFDKIFKKKN